MTGFESMILCPDTDAGHEALHDAIQDGWEIYCQWRERIFVTIDDRARSKFINHIALRRSRPTETGDD